MFETNYEEKIAKITKWIASIVEQAGFEDVIVAVSGGIDSAVALSLAVKALGKEHVCALKLPYGKFSNTATQDAKEVIASLGISKEHVFQRDIYKTVNKMLRQIDDKDMSDIRKGNIMARVRMTYLYDLAKATNSLVIGTENKSENLLGYFTRFGDEASDIEPIRSLYKTQVWEMGKVLGIPEKIITKAPSAGLWDGQTDEKEFGFSYQQADEVLYHFVEEELQKEAIVDLGIPEEIVTKVLARMQSNAFKHHLPKVFEK